MNFTSTGKKETEESWNESVKAWKKALGWSPECGGTERWLRPVHCGQGLPGLAPRWGEAGKEPAGSGLLGAHGRSVHTGLRTHPFTFPWPLSPLAFPSWAGFSDPGLRSGD